tara:strand:- start:577 stop:756 length:180 start_codon:yes stop_codon:yes gene_type:complete
MKQELTKRIELLRLELSDIVEIANLLDGPRWYKKIAEDALKRDSDRQKLDESLEQKWRP